MLAAWSILNKLADRNNATFPTPCWSCARTSRSAAGCELDPNQAEASVYRTRDLVPERLMPELRRGRVIVTNWHVLEPQTSQVGGTSARAVKAGRPQVGREVIRRPRRGGLLTEALRRTGSKRRSREFVLG